MMRLFSAQSFKTGREMRKTKMLTLSEVIAAAHDRTRLPAPR